MKRFDKILIVITIMFVLMLVGANWGLFHKYGEENGRAYRVEINRIASLIQENGLEKVDLSQCTYVTGIEKISDHSAAFYHVESDYVVREIGGELYRIDYVANTGIDPRMIWLVNMILIGMALFTIGVMVVVRFKILLPFDTLKQVPYELSRGNLTVPLRESKSRFFGNFVWGLDLLRENIEQQKQKELDLQREKKTVLLSISHDSKTLLSAIKLYAKALSKGVYSDREKLIEIAENINAKADEMEGFLSQMIQASREDFLYLEVNLGEFYLSALLDTITDYYQEKLSLIRIDFVVERYSNCLLQGDLDRSVEVLQNIMENAIKYGDGHSIEILFAEEEDCQLLTVRNSGCTLSETELVHVFDSFWQGSNSNGKKGSGLGLYICRQLMNQMNGEVYAEIKEGCMLVTVVFVKV